MTTLSLLILLTICSLSLFFYRTQVRLFKLVPFGLLVAVAILILFNFDSLNVASVTAGWNTLPALMINVVFATLFLGKKIISPKKIWQFAGPQIVFGQTLAWGQYVVGIVLTALVLVPVYNMSPLAGALIEISFEGGHGTAAGLQPLFNELNFADGADLALGLATVGIAVGLFSGLLMTAIVRLRHKKPKRPSQGKTRPLVSLFGSFILQTRSQFFSRYTVVRTFVQIALVLVAIGIGVLLKSALVQLEDWLRLLYDVPQIIQHIPLFPLAMIGGILLQVFLNTFGASKLVHGKTIAFIGAMALEIVIVAAIATMSLATISSNFEPFLLLATAGTIWNVAVFLILAPRIMSGYWFERGVGDYGQSMGMTATGLLLMKTADPSNRSQALERFGYKQLLFEPIVGGGLFTAASMILISRYGLGVMFVLTLVVTIFWTVLGLVSFSHKRTRPKSDA